MKIISVFYILLGVTILFSCSQEIKSVSGPDLKVVANDNEPDVEIKKNTEGERVFNSNCEKCHGTDGKTTENDVKDLSISVLSMDERIEVISSAQIIGSRLHAPRFVEVLTEQDIKNVAEYIESFRK